MKKSDHLNAREKEEFERIASGMGITPRKFGSAKTWNLSDFMKIMEEMDRRENAA